MKGYHIQKTPIEERAVAIAEYIVKNKATVRQAAGQFGVSKSTVHKDVTERLLRINPSLAAKARKILDVNKSERHIRGGMATKEKYSHLHAERQMFPGNLTIKLLWENAYVSGKSNELMKRRWSGLSGVALFLHIQTEKKGKNVYKL